MVEFLLQHLSGQPGLLLWRFHRDLWKAPLSYQMLFCTVPDAASGQKIADALVGEQLAGCVNLLPGITSTYAWQGKVQRDTECLLLIKTRAHLFSAVRDRIIALHPYDVPEVIALPIADGLKPYLSWISENTLQP